MAEKKERNTLSYTYIKKMMDEHATDEQWDAFLAVAYGYCKTIIVKSKKEEGKLVRSFEWVKDEAEIAEMRAKGVEPSYNKKAAEEWFKANMAEYVPTPKEKLDTRSMLRERKK